MSLPSDNPVLDARGLVFPAGGAVLNQAGLAVGEGETVAVLGAPGAGKSALMSCLSGEAAVAAGAVWTNGRPVHLLSAEQRHAFRLRHYGLVHQELVFLPELTLAQSTALPLRFAGMGQREAETRARRWLARFEIEDAASQRPSSVRAAAMSVTDTASVTHAGSTARAASTAAQSPNALSVRVRSHHERPRRTHSTSASASTPAPAPAHGRLSTETLRRAALARAMVNDPLVLFADEPFVGLSEESTVMTTRILHSIARSHGTAVIVFTSDARTAERCERIVHLVAGRTTTEPIPAAAIEPLRPVDFSVGAPDGASPSPARVWQ